MAVDDDNDNHDDGGDDDDDEDEWLEWRKTTDFYGTFPLVIHTHTCRLSACYNKRENFHTFPLV